MVILPAPLVIAAAAMGAASLIQNGWNIYSTYKRTSGYDRAYNYTLDYHKGYNAENTRYWENYIRRHHLDRRTVLYPYRTGMNYDLSRMYSAEANINANKYARYDAWMKLATGGMKAGASLYGSAR